MFALFNKLPSLVTIFLLWSPALLLAELGRRLLRQCHIRRQRGSEGERQVAAVLKRLRRPVLHDILIADGRGGLTQIDHVLHMPGGLLALETKNYRGDILGHADAAQWTQRLGTRRFSLPNPLWQNAGHVRALQRLLPDIPVWGWVVFTDRARFIDERPEGVSSLAELGADLGPLLALPVNARVAPAWRQLRQAARRDRAARRAHLAQLRKRHGRDRHERLGLVLLASAGIWTGAVAVLVLLR